MNIAECIMYLYPDADPTKDFRVEDDGSGAKLKYWNLEVPKPTTKELKAVWLDALKKSKIAQVKVETKKRIERDYPDWISVRWYEKRELVIKVTKSEHEDYNKYLAGKHKIREASNRIESQIDNLTTDELEKLDISKRSEWNE